MRAFRKWLTSGAGALVAMGAVLASLSACSQIGHAASGTRSENSVSVLSVSVRGSGYAEAVKRFGGNPPASTPVPGMTVRLRVHSADEVMRSNVALTSAVDDTGKRLDGGVSFNQLRSPSRDLIAPRTHEAFWDVTFDRLPADGAEEVRLVGKVMVHVGKHVATLNRRVALKTGEHFDAAGTTFTISSAGEGGELAFLAPALPPDFLNLALADEKGTLYASMPSLVQRMGSQGVRLIFSLKEQPAEANAEVSYYDVVTDETIPFELKFGVGY